MSHAFNLFLTCCSAICICCWPSVPTSKHKHVMATRTRVFINNQSSSQHIVAPVCSTLYTSITQTQTLILYITFYFLEERRKAFILYFCHHYQNFGSRHPRNITRLGCLMFCAPLTEQLKWPTKVLMNFSLSFMKWWWLKSKLNHFEVRKIVSIFSWLLIFWTIFHSNTFEPTHSSVQHVLGCTQS